MSWLLIYPDTYEIGLPNQGLQILYEILNERADAVAERAYAPWVDMEASMRSAGVPLFSLENHLPAGDFDILAFNLSAELVYTNVLNLIDLSDVPVRGAARTLDDPIVVAGGHCAFNPEPLADFVDCFVLGDGEEVIGEVNDVATAWKAERLTRAPGRPASRQTLLRALAQVPGVYVPGCYEAHYEPSDPRRPRSDPSRHRRRFPGWWPPLPGSPRHRSGWRSGPSPTSAGGPIPDSSWCPLSKWSTTGSTSKSSGAAPEGAASARPA